MMERAIVEYMVNAVWQFPLLAAGAWLLLRAAKPGSQVQHDVWLAVLGLGVLLPAHGMAIREPHPQPPMTVTYERTDGDKILLSQKPHLLTHTVLLNATATRWLVRLYLATVVLALLRIARSWIVARRLVVHSQATSRQRAALAHYSQQFGVKIPQLRESADVASPMIVGVRTPVLLLPEGFDRFPEDQVAAVFCHELAHIRRQDYLMNLFCQVAALPLAWHPVVYEVQQRIRTTREMICDAMAAQEIRSHVGYAKCLLALAHSMLAERGMTGRAQFLGLFSNNTLEERVMRLMEPTTMTIRTRVARMAGGAAVMVAALSLAAILHVIPTLAQSAASTPPAAQATPAAAQTTSPAAAPEPAASPMPVKPNPTVRVVRKKDLEEKTEQQVEDVERELAKALAMADNPELKQRAEEAQREALKASAMVDSTEFKQRMEDMRRQIAKAAAMQDSAQFKRNMEHAKRQMAEARARLDNPEFKRQMEDMQRQMANAAARLNSPEFRQRMDDLQEEIQRRMAEQDSRRRNPPSPPEEAAPTN
jgi:beta-lactamase regulating signal transducer with metallopeptidase domain